MRHFDRLGWKNSKPVKRELEARRSFYGKVFEHQDGTLSLKQQLGTPVHYKENTLDPDAPFLDIDLEPRVFSDRWEFNQGLYSLTVGDTGEVQYRSRAYGDMTWRPLAVGGSDALKANAIRHEVRGFRDFIVFEDVRPGVDMIVRVGSAKMEPLFQIKTPQASREFLWEIDAAEDAFFSLGEGGKGWDNHRAKGPRRELDVQRIDSPATVVGGRRKQITEEVWGGGVFDRDSQRQKVRRINPRYPVLIDPPDVTENIVNGADDVSQVVATASKFYSTTTGIAAGFGKKAGVRFRTVAINQGQSISAARLIGVPAVVSFFPGPCNIFGDDVDDAPLWGALNGPVNGVTPTTASATIDPVTNGVACTGAVTGIIQEIVSRSGWTSGADMRFVISSGAAGGFFAAYEHTAANPFKLEVTFASATGGGNPWYVFAQQ